MRILVTGGAGYLGSTLCRFLLLDHDVTVLDDFRYGQTSLASLCLHPDLDIIVGDVRDPALVNSLLAKHDIIIPLAAVVGAPACSADITAATSINRYAVEALATKASRDQWIIIPTTNSGYGIGTAGDECTEDSPLRPLSLYGQTKVAAEEAVMARANSISLRLATVYGCSPRMRLDLLLNDFVYRAVKDRCVTLFEPHFKRNFLHVQDCARAFVHAIDNFGRMKGNIFNCGDSMANLSKVELCEAIKRTVPDFHVAISEHGTDPDKRDYIVSNAKLEATGWKSKVSLDEGIAELEKFCRTLKGRHGNA